MMMMGLLMLCTTALAQQKVKRLYVAKPGTMVELLTEEEANQITHLTLQGRINAIDFRHLRDEFTSLKMLDLSGVSISNYIGKHGTHPDSHYLYPSNVIPAYAFCRRTGDSTYVGKETLEHIILSDKIRNIEDAAFKGCKNLRICQIRRKSAPNLFPEALADSITAIFVPLGSSDSYRTKPRWGTFAFVEGEPCHASLTLNTQQSLGSELVKQGIQPKEVNFLVVKGKLDEADFKLIRDYMPNLVSIDLTESEATAIPEFTFTQKKYLLRVQLPRQLERIGQRAFSGCGRLCGTLHLPASVTAIEYGAFIGCTNLRYVAAHGNRITTLGDNLFGDSQGKLIYVK
ncbi:MAG: leucine-rich repeat protein [Bacteroides sp.]